MAPFDPYYGADELTGSVRFGFPVTPDDEVPLNGITRQIWVGGAGDITFYAAGDPPGGISKVTGLTTVPTTLKNVPAGTMLHIAARVIMATGTTATYIVGMI